MPAHLHFEDWHIGSRPVGELVPTDRTGHRDEPVHTQPHACTSPGVKHEASEHSDGGSDGTQIYRPHDSAQADDPKALANASNGLEPSSWVHRLCNCTFFSVCEAHPLQRRNECTFFCLDCEHTQALCTYCLSAHTSCRVLQLRRYVYRDVVKLGDIQKYMDASGVQTYIVNHAKAIFISAKDRQPTGCYFRTDSTSVCRACGRGLREGSLYCSLNCKVAVYGDKVDDLLTPAPLGGWPATEAPAASGSTRPQEPAQPSCKAPVKQQNELDVLAVPPPSSLPHKRPAVEQASALPRSSLHKRTSRRKQANPSRALD